MISFIKKLLGVEKREELIFAALDKGAQIIDVRTEGEFSGGHIKGSKNIPLNKVVTQADKLIKSGKPVIVCCASGMRSGQARSVLASKGVEVYNGGSWTGLQSLMNRHAKRA